MTIDRKDLIELYKITLEELRHHERIYVQAIIGTAILVPAFLVAISFLFGSDSLVYPQYVTRVKWIVLGLAVILAGLLGYTLYRINERFKACNKVLTNIESELRVDKRTSGTSKFEGLLIKRELDKIKIEQLFVGKRFWVYSTLLVVAFVLLGLVLFVFIK